MVGHAAPKEGVAFDDRLQRVIMMMADATKVFWCGQVGLGLAAKISNNYISCSVLLLVAEAMAIGVESGVDPKLLHEIIHNSTGQTFMGDNVCPIPDVVPHAPSSNSWRLGFRTQMFLKDLSLGIDAAHQLNLHSSMAEAAYKVYEKASEDPQCIVRIVTSASNDRFGCTRLTCHLRIETDHRYIFTLREICQPRRLKSLIPLAMSDLTGFLCHSLSPDGGVDEATKVQKTEEKSHKIRDNGPSS
jgi:hypothetical protein